MKKTGFWRGFGLGLILTVAVTALSVSAMAATASRTIQVEEGVQISLNGATFVPRDAKGNEVSVFLYNGTTYVPLRAVGEAHGHGCKLRFCHQDGYPGDGGQECSAAGEQHQQLYFC